MLFKRGLIASLLFCAAFAVSVRAEPLGKQPAGRLVALCEAVASPTPTQTTRADAAVCLAFVDGFIWGHAWAAWREAKTMWFCLPEGFALEHGARAVVDYVAAHPERLTEESRLVVFLALTSAYPCRP